MNVTPDGDYQTYKAESRRLRARELLRPRPARARARQGLLRRRRSGTSSAAATTTARCTRRSRRPSSTRASPPSSSRRRSRATASVRSFEGRNATHQMKKMTLDNLKHVPRRDAHPDHRRAARGEPVPAAVLPPRRPGRGDPVPARAPPRARRLPARAPHEPRRRSRCPTTSAYAIAEEGLRHAGDRHDHGVRPAAEGPAAREGLRQPHRADHPRRGAHLRHGRVLPDREDLQPERPALHVGRPRAAPGLQGEPAGPDPARRHQRGRRASRRSPPSARRTRRTASRSSRSTSSTRCSGSSAPATRMWAAGDQMARGFIIGATAGRTTLTGEGLQHADGHSHLLASTNPATVVVRPRLRLRDRAHRALGPRAHVRRQPPRPERHVLPHGLQRADRAARRARGRRRRRHRARHPPHLDEPTGDGPEGAAARVRRRRAVGARGAAAARERLGRARPTSGRSRRWTELRRDGLAADEHNFLHPDDEPRTAVRHAEAAGRRRARSSPSPTSCTRCRTRSARACPATSRRSAPTASASPTRAPAARRFFKIDGPSIVVRTLAAARRRGEVDRVARRRRRSRSTGCTT